MYEEKLKERRGDFCSLNEKNCREDFSLTLKIDKSRSPAVSTDRYNYKNGSYN
jgi:hypothetical protein